MKGIIAMKDDDQGFVVQAVNFSKAVRVRPIMRIARLRNSYCVAIGTKRTCWGRLTMSAREGKPGVPREPGHFRF
jgi:hypothetical protein